MTISIILAAGKGTRMNSDLPKVLHPLLNRAMIHYVIDIAENVPSEKIFVIVGYKRDLIIDELSKKNKREVLFITQEAQLGTGHALLMAEEYFKKYSGNLLILYGDNPVIDKNVIPKFINFHEKNNNAATILTLDEENPTGYGRIIKDIENNLIKTIEEKDIYDSEISKIKEVSAGTFIFKSEKLFNVLSKIKNDNKQGEYYLPDALKLLIEKGEKIGVYKMDNPGCCHGINTPEQLKNAEDFLNLSNFIQKKIIN